MALNKLKNSGAVWGDPESDPVVDILAAKEAIRNQVGYHLTEPDCRLCRWEDVPVWGLMECDRCMGFLVSAVLYDNPKEGEW